MILYRCLRILIVILNWCSGTSPLMRSSWRIETHGRGSYAKRAFRITDFHNEKEVETNGRPTVLFRSALADFAPTSFCCFSC